MHLQEISREVWRDNYKAPKEKTHRDLWNRLAMSASEPEKENKHDEVYQDFLWLLDDFKGVSGGRITSNLGVEKREGTSLINCFVHGPTSGEFQDADSINGIYEMLKSQALTLKSEGGYGMNFSWLRPNGTYIKGIGARTPGVLKFMELWDKSSEIITKGSNKVLGDRKPEEKIKIRKGAQMGVLEIWHPEIEDFIDAKLIPNRLEKFNLSVGITNGFIDAVKNNKKWELKFPDTEHKNYKTEWFGDIEDWESKGYPVVIYKKVDATFLWDKIMKSTYTRNDPGVLFLDIINKYNSLTYAEKIFTTNPCGEIPMAAAGICNLFSLNVVKYIVKIDADHYAFDYDKFRKAVGIAVRFADNINDISKVPLEEYKKSMIEKRRIGVGVMGLGSLHYILGVRFGSDESLRLIEDIFRAKSETELLASANLGKEKGSFKHFDKEKYFNTYWWKHLPISKDIKQEIEKIGEMRNSHRSANAPTGNNATYAQCVSGGIEPVPFGKEYVRWTIVSEKEQQALKEKGFKFPNLQSGEWCETKHMKLNSIKNGDTEDFFLEGSFEDQAYKMDKNRGLTKYNLVKDYGWEFVENNFSEERISELEEKGTFVSTSELSVKEHIDTLKIISRYTDMGTSKTINVAKDYSYEEFKHVYLDAWKAGIKGITTYRAGTMAAVLEKKEEIQEERAYLENIFLKANGNVIKDKYKLPDEYFSKGYIINDNNHKKWYVNIAFADKNLTKPFALFVSTNCKESNEVADETVNSMFKLAKSNGIPKALIDEHWEKCQGQTNVTRIARTIGFCLRHNIPRIEIVNILDQGNYPLSSFSFHIKRLLKQFIKDGTPVTGKHSTCPQCKEQLVFIESCVKCPSCQWSRCS